MIRTIGACPFSSNSERMKEAQKDVDRLNSISRQLKTVTEKLDAELAKLGAANKENFDSYDSRLLGITRDFGNGGQRARKSGRGSITQQTKGTRIK